MFRFLSRTISPTAPKLVSSPNNPCAWLASRLISTPSSPSSVPKGNSFAVSYLISTCGFPPERAISVSKRISFETGEKPDAVIGFFKSHGFSQSAALRVIRTQPRLLAANPQKSLQPKIDFFESEGFSSSDVRNIISGCPDILGRSLQNEIIPSFDFFSNMFQSRHKLMKAVIGYSGILCDFGKRLEPNIKLLREVGVPESHIVRLVEDYPRALKVSPKRFKETVRELKELEFDPLKPQFVVVVRAKVQISKSTWARKEGVYRKWGWTDYDSKSAFRVHPCCMLISEGKIEAIMDFLVSTLGYKSSDIARCPAVLSMSLGKRIVPRGSVILVLLSKGLVSKPSLEAIFKCVEKTFLNRYIFRQEKEADALLKLYRAKLA